MDEVILVDTEDREIGTAEKLAAHSPPGQLHRAFSVFLFNERSELLLQRRALHKYHFAGLWSNSCCSHPRPGEGLLSAARRRVAEELGVHCELTAVGSFLYTASDPASGLVENEIDHIVVGLSGESMDPDRDEVHSTAYRDLASLREDLQRQPSRYTPWLSPALDGLAAMEFEYRHALRLLHRDG